MPPQPLRHMVTVTSPEAKPLNVLQEVPNLDKYRILRDVADFMSRVATHSKGLLRFAIITELRVSSGPGPGVQLACLDMSLVIIPFFKRFESVIITVYTLAPLALSPKLLQFELCVLESFNM